MPTTKPFAYNTGSTISNTQQIGNLAIATGGTIGGNVTWWMGPDEDLGYVIAVPVSGGTQPTNAGLNAFLGFYRTQSKTESNFISFCNYLSNGTESFQTGFEALQWLFSQGYWGSFPNVQPVFSVFGEGNISIDSLNVARSWGSGVYGRLGNNSTNSEVTPVAVCGGLSFQKIVSNGVMNLGITTTGIPYTWGYAFWGALGNNNSITDRSVPVAVCGNHTFTEISVNYTFCAALNNNGQAYMWGDGSYGRLGNSDITSRETPVAVCGSHTFIDISCGNGHVLGLKSNGSIFSWGYNFFGELGNNSTTDYSTPVAVCGESVFTKILAVMNSSYGLTSTGQLYSWGDNTFGQLGDNTNQSKSTPVAVCGGLSFVDVFGSGQFPTIFAITSTGSLYGWGFNLEGSLGIGTNGGDGDFTSTPIAVASSLSFSTLYATVYADRSTFIGITRDGGMYGWGKNSHLQLGNTNETPKQVTGFTFSNVYGASEYACGLISTNLAYCWGSPQSGRLGNNDESVSVTPVAVCGGFSFSHLATGYYTHTLGLTTTGVLYAWGNNFTGALGNNTTVNRSTPVAVCGGGRTYCQIEAGPNRSYALASTGLLYAWGDNTSGQLGINSTVSRITPVAVCGGLTFASISAGLASAYGITTAGVTYAWGSGTSGILGDNSSIDKSTPVAVCGGLTFCKISAGNYHVLGITTSGIVYSWGQSVYGELGDNTLVAKSTPVAVCGGITFKDIAAGDTHSLGLATNGTLYGWGSNLYGELGTNNYPTSYSTPVLVCGGFVFNKISAGQNTSYGITSGGQLYSWGKNTVLELGLNNFINTPTTVSGLF